MNHETETVLLWFNNDPGLYDLVTSKADTLYDTCEEDIGEVIVQLKEWLGALFGEADESIPDYQRDLLQDALDKVQWAEIAIEFTELYED